MSNPAQMLNARGLRVDQVVAAWPDTCALVMLHSAAQHERWGRWSVLSHPARYESITEEHPEPLRWLMGVLQDTPRAVESPDPIPFVGGWIGYFSYELGRAIEPATKCRLLDADGWPLIELAYCPAALVHDNLLNVWHAVGPPAAVRELVERLDFAKSTEPRDWRSGEMSCEVPADSHLAAVTRTLAYIGAGDIFQANITHPLSASFTGCTRSLARHALALSGARYGAYLELPDGRCIVSMSPELFLQVDAGTRTVTTRPIKGTRPQQCDPLELDRSAKDAAELNMITDLMRNDLGRVCEYGSIRVAESRAIESHPTVHHGVSTITGTLRDDVRLPQLLAATFPAGSVTGAPKIRAMQIIEELETRRRGPYCGAIGMISARGDIALNVAIRTMLLRGHRIAGAWNQLDGMMTYGVGGGIVADSKPLDEYRESMDKAAILRMALRHPLASADEPHADLRV